MAIGGLLTAPDTPAGFYSWSFSHAVNHHDIIRRIKEIDPTQMLDEYVLDPFNPQDMETWLVQHQVMHDQMNAVLGISGFDLSVLDWEDPEDLSVWLAHNANLHYIASNQLGIG